MRGINRTAVLDTIRREGPIARTQIAEALQISLMTVMRIADELEAEDLIRPTGTKEYSGGRKRPLLEFNATGHLVIGVDMNENRLYGVVADLAGNVLIERTTVNSANGKYEYEPLEALIENLLQFARQTEKHIRGIGIGASGITYTRGDQVCWAPSYEWRDFPLKEKLENRFALPVIMDNDVNLAVLGEMWFGVGQNSSNLVLMLIGSGVGAGIITNGAVYRGSHLTAGEIGFLLPDRASLGVPREGFGALEALASSTSIVAKARRILKDELSEEELAALTASQVCDAYYAHEAWAQNIIRDVFDYLAQAVAALAVCFDPDMIIINQEICQVPELLIEGLYRRIEGTIPLRPKIVASKLGHRGIVMGTIIEILYNTSDYYMVRKLN
ncbi:MAG: ROK family transcriptional regulator [Anaerolineae bacterium]|nr:ROK family transcriptional regulator [Anaerolineae bacterium]